MQSYSFNAARMNSHSDYCRPHTHIRAESDCVLLSEHPPTPPPTVISAFTVNLTCQIQAFRLNGLSTHRAHLKRGDLLIIFSN